jgi:hypothetical protein
MTSAAPEAAWGVGVGELPVELFSSLFYFTQKRPKAPVKSIN